MNRLAAIATASALFYAGLFLGLAVRRRAPEPGRHLSSETMRRNPAPPGVEAPTPAPEIPKLEARVRELEAELSTLRSGRAKPGSEPAPTALAEEIFKGYLELHQSKNPDPEIARTFLARLGQLDENSRGTSSSSSGNPEDPTATTSAKSPWRWPWPAADLRSQTSSICS